MHNFIVFTSLKSVTYAVSCEMYTQCSRLPFFCKAAIGSDCEDSIPAEVNLETKNSCQSSCLKSEVIKDVLEYLMMKWHVLLLHCRLALKGADMGQTDYDGRTALHIAAAEGKIHIIEFLLDKCNVPHSPLDR